MAQNRRVFLSCTSEMAKYPEQKSFINAAKDAVVRAGFALCYMEDFTARDQSTAQYCINKVCECDVYVGIIGIRYGTPVRDRPEVSYTELEFEAASKASDKARLIFLLDPSTPVPPNEFVDYQYRERQEAFRERLKNDPGITCKDFKTFFDLEQFIYQALIEALPPSASGRHSQDGLDWPENESPYPGLEWFGEKYASLFFGRDQEVNKLVDMLNKPNGRFLIVSGPSGSGKSSLVGAGLWKALIKDGRLLGSQCTRWLRIRSAADRGGPFVGLAAGLQHVFPQISEKKEDFATTLASKPTAFNDHIASRLTQGHELVLFVDGLEELFTQRFLSVDIQLFLSWLVTKSSEPQNRLRVVVTVQTEYLERLKSALENNQQIIHEGFQLAIKPVSRQALSEMIEKPAHRTGYIFETDLVKCILDDVDGAADSLPLVAYVLKQLFERREGAKVFTHKAYAEMGRVIGAIAYKADEVVKTLGRGIESSLYKVFAELVYFDQDRPPMGRRAHMSTFKDDKGANKLIERLSQPDCRVLVIKDEMVEVAHEKLLVAWTKLADWLRDDNIRNFLLWKQWLRVAICKYEENHRASHQLLIKSELSKALDWLEKHPSWISPEELAFIQRSQRRQRGKNVLVWVSIVLVVAGIWSEGWFRANGYTLKQQFHRIVSIFSIGRYPDPLEREMVRIPGGTFCMGRDDWRYPSWPQPSWLLTVCMGLVVFGDSTGSVERLEGQSQTPPHVVNIKPFMLGKYEVTFEEYDRYAIAKGRRLPSDQEWGRGDQPVMDVTWEDAKEYANWLSEKTGKVYRLPSESEWEYAARGGEKQQTWAGVPKECGEDKNCELEEYAWFINNSGSRPQRVGQRTPNHFGLYDLSGNVWEWVQDCLHDTYEGAPSDGASWDAKNKEKCKIHMFRGGSWFNDSGLLRTFERGRLDAKSRTNGIGFRLAQDIKP